MRGVEPLPIPIQELAERFPRVRGVEPDQFINAYETMFSLHPWG